MDLLTFVTLVLSIASSQAIRCHDCTSWNPYCREKVNEPFSEAVASVDCNKTDTCFIKKEESGVISRGCTDWWMETKVDIGYEGCRTQDVEWVGKQTWCFCKSDHCNGASIEMLESGVIPEAPKAPKIDIVEKSNRIQDDGWVGWDFSRDWQQWDKTEGKQDDANQGDTDQEWKNWDEIVTVPWSEWEHDGTGRKSTPAPALAADADTKPDQKFDDTNPEYNMDDMDHSQDPAWRLWWWHAESDRPTFNDFEKTWKAPNWVEEHDGEGWDFPVTSRDNKDIRTTTTEKVWTWGKGWGHIFPWWSGRRLPITTARPAVTSAWWTESTAAPTEHPVIIQNEGDNTLDEIVEKPQDNNELEVSDDQFFCWDCYSDSPLCRKRVNTQKAHYLGKTPCPSTNKCFVRKQGDVVYRGCADGWTSSVISHDYVGCRTQMLWGKPVEWCFCTASLCNGDSMEDIKEKYRQPNPHAFKGNLTTTRRPDTTNADKSTTEDSTTVMTTEDTTLTDTTSDASTSRKRSTTVKVDKTTIEVATKRDNSKSKFMTVLAKNGH